jgi:hypothetical protein
VQADRLAHGAVDDHHERRAAGARRRTVQRELGVADGGKRRAHHREVLRPAAGHDRIDRRVPRRDRAVPHRLVEQHRVGPPRSAREHPLHERRGGRHDRQAIRPALGEAGLDRLPGVLHVEAGIRVVAHVGLGERA